MQIIKGDDGKVYEVADDGELTVDKVQTRISFHTKQIDYHNEQIAYCERLINSLVDEVENSEVTANELREDDLAPWADLSDIEPTPVPKPETTVKRITITTPDDEADTDDIDDTPVAPPRFVG